MASKLSCGEESEKEEPVHNDESVRGPVAMKRGKQENCENKSRRDWDMKEMDGFASDDGSGDESGEEVWQEQRYPSPAFLQQALLKIADFKKNNGAVSGGAMGSSVAESGDVRGKSHVSKQQLAAQRKEKMLSWREALKGDLVKKGAKLEKKRIEIERKEEKELEKQEKTKFKFKNNKEERTDTLSNMASDAGSFEEQMLKKKSRRRSGGEGEGTSLEGNENAEEKKGRRSGEEENCGGEKMMASGEGVTNLNVRKLEQIATLKGILLSKGISKVAVSGLSKGEKKRCPLPPSLVAEVRSAGLLFVKCSEIGVAIETANFYLGRAYGLHVVNASFLLDWEETQKLPNLDNYVVVGSYLKGGKVVPLKPIKEKLMFGEAFRICSFKGNDYPVDLIKELITRMGGSLVDEDSTDVKAYNIGSEFIQGKEMFRPDWVLDMVEVLEVLVTWLRIEEMVGVTTLEDRSMEVIQTLRVKTLEVLQGSGRFW